MNQLRMLETHYLLSHFVCWDADLNLDVVPDPEDYISADIKGFAAMIDEPTTLTAIMMREESRQYEALLGELISLNWSDILPLSAAKLSILPQIQKQQYNRRLKSATIEALKLLKDEKRPEAESVLQQYFDGEREEAGKAEVGNAVSAAVDYYQRMELLLTGQKLPSKIDLDVSLFEKHLNAGVGGGLHTGQIGCIAARPGRGKSSFGFWLVRAALKADPDLRACIVTLEMPASDVCKKFMDSSLHEHQARFERYPTMAQLSWALGDSELLLNRLCILEQSPLGADEIVQNAKRLAKNGCRLFLLDYLQLVDCGDIAPEALRIAYSDIVRKLTLDAKDNDRCWIVLSQLSRSAEGRVPVMSDLKETSAIEENCHWIVALNREDPPLSQVRSDGLHPWALQTHVLKNRYGPSGQCVQWRADWVRNYFEEQ